MGTALLLVGSQKSSLTRCIVAAIVIKVNILTGLFLDSFFPFITLPTIDWGGKFCCRDFSLTFSDLSDGYDLVLVCNCGWKKVYIHKCCERSMHLIHTHLETMWKKNNGLLNLCKLDQESWFLELSSFSFPKCRSPLESFQMVSTLKDKHLYILSFKFLPC